MADSGNGDAKENNGATERAKETHGRRDDVKAPNVFERAKEEIQALVDVVHTHARERDRPHPDSAKRDPTAKEEPKLEKAEDHGVKAPNLFERAKEELEAIIHHDQSPSSHPHIHDKETHGRNNDIDYDTLIDEVKGPSVFERAKEEIEAIVEVIHPHVHDKETHGRSDDIDYDTPISEVKGPNVFERAKEEIEALVEAIHPKKEATKDNSSHAIPPNKESGFDLGATVKEHGFRSSIGKEDHGEKAPNLFERAREELEAIIHHDKSHSSHSHIHDKETHGSSDDIDYDTPIDEVKGPSFFERAKEIKAGGDPSEK